jgi:MFS family permease
MGVVITCGVGVWPASYALASEASSLHLRGRAQGIGGTTQGGITALFGFILPYMFNPDKGNLRAKLGFVFTGFCLLSALVGYLYAPEMKGRTPAEIDAMFDLNLPARAFESWASESTMTTDPEKNGNQTAN